MLNSKRTKMQYSKEVQLWLDKGNKITIDKPVYNRKQVKEEKIRKLQSELTTKSNKEGTIIQYKTSLATVLTNLADILNKASKEKIEKWASVYTFMAYNLTANVYNYKNEYLEKSGFASFK